LCVEEVKKTYIASKKSKTDIAAGQHFVAAFSTKFKESAARGI
jgi:hypothetical protein